MPVSQTDSTTDDNADVDTFVGQSQPPKVGSQQPLADRVASNLQKSAQTTFVSQLQQPLRPPQSQGQVQSPPPVQSRGHSVFENSSTVQMQQQQQFLEQTAPGIAPPPMGPPMNFHRQAPLTHASILTWQNNSPMHYPEDPAAQALAAPPHVLQPPTSPTGQHTAHQAPMEHTQRPTTFSQSEQPISSSPLGVYVPVKPHWFYNKEIEEKSVWLPFSMLDSINLEEAATRQATSGGEVTVTTDGGRYDVNVHMRLRQPVYWKEAPSKVRRCTWFYKLEGQNRFVPYEEEVASILEEHFSRAVTTGAWHQRLQLPGDQTVVMHNASVMVHFLPSSHPDEWGNVNEGQTRPRVVKRGVEEVDTIEDGEPSQIDHLVFVVHGVGSVCDFRFRSVEECLDDIRSISLGLLRSHFSIPSQEGKIGRIEFLPVSWHSTLHGDATGIDSALKHITLKSIPKLRHFTNDTLLDILFYTSPVYCQTIVDTVGSEINRIYWKFKERNPGFSGTIALAGHSLGSLILYDILSHQDNPHESTPQGCDNDVVAPEQFVPSELSLFSEEPEEKPESREDMSVESIFQELLLEDYLSKIHEEQIDLETLKMCSEGDLKEMGLPMGPRKKLLSYMKELSQKQSQQKAEMVSNSKVVQHVQPTAQGPALSQVGHKRESVASVNYAMGTAGTGQLSVSYPKIDFHPSCFFALGSPIAMFLVVRGNETLGEDFRLPTCPAFFNIFHPFDPVAYRMESLVDPTFTANPVLIPHHKGRKRMHLELKESLSRMGSDLKQRFLDSLRYTWNSLNEFARAHRPTPAQVEAEVDRVLQEQFTRQDDSVETESTVTVSDLQGIEDIGVGQLNGGRRIDYVLQEKPIESFNEYLFALASHACYWESEDTVLLMLKELYALQGVTPHLIGRSLSQPKVQLYNPAVLSSIAPSRPASMLPSPQSSVSSAHSQMHLTMSPAAPTAPTASASMSGDGATPPPPPPLQGFVRVSPLVRK